MPYGCHNQPRPSGASKYPAQNGWESLTVDNRRFESRLPVIVHVKHAMSTACMYDGSTKDAGCTGCMHRPPDPLDRPPYIYTITAYDKDGKEIPPQPK